MSMAQGHFVSKLQDHRPPSAPLTNRVGNNGLARQILPQARIWRSQILARIPRIPWILELDSARILTWMPPKLDYNPRIRLCVEPCSTGPLNQLSLTRRVVF